MGTDLEFTNRIGGLMVSDEVAIFCELELINTGQKCLEMKLEPTTATNQL